MSLPTKQLVKLHLAAHEDGSLPEMTIKMIRQRLADDYAWSCDDERWKTIKAGIKEWWAEQDVPVTSSPASPQANTSISKKVKTVESDERSSAKPQTDKISSKYERAAHKNLQNFIGMVGGDVMGAAGEDDDEEDHEDGMDDFIEDEQGLLGQPDANDSEDESSSGSSTPPVKARKQKPKKSEDGGPSKKGKKRKSLTTSTSGNFKSAETIYDSDDSGADIPGGDDGSDDENEADAKSAKSKKKRKSDASTKSKGKGHDEDASKKRRKDSGSTPKEGDAKKGTDQEEARIKKLKSLVSAAGTARVFNASTGAERTLSVETRMKHLESLLRDAGLKCGSGVNGALPSLAQAKKVGEKRELAREMEELKGAPILSGLRTGKKLSRPVDQAEYSNSSGSEEDDDQPRPPPKKFGSFLGDQSSDSD